MNTGNDVEVWASMLAASFAQAFGLPPGNLWEPPVSRHLAKRAAEVGKAQTEREYRVRFGME